MFISRESLSSKLAAAVGGSAPSAEVSVFATNVANADGIEDRAQIFAEAAQNPLLAPLVPAMEEAYNNLTLAHNAV